MTEYQNYSNCLVNEEVLLNAWLEAEVKKTSSLKKLREYQILIPW